MGFLPPSSRVKRVMFCSAAAPTCLPTAVEPVKDTLFTSGWETSALPATEPLPSSTLNTPAGTPASIASSARRRAVSGVSSAGLMMMVQPQASAGMTFHSAIIIGKFHGTMPAMTPAGSRRV
ncbi:hypothetical protein D9M68_407340 [compost metagenome]